MREGSGGSRLRRILSAAVAVMLVAGVLAVTSMEGTAAASTDPTPRDGSTSTNAAPSCWSIKQNFPSSPDGLYWLRTPTLEVPDQFYCDMTTDGGGWVLIGRGREGWSFPYEGQDTPRTLREIIDGPGAFSPASLPTETVVGLLDGGRMDALDDGIRVRRAADQAGTTWQEVRMKVKDYDQWSWAFGGGIYLRSISFNGTVFDLATSNFQTNTTANTNISNDTLRVDTRPATNKNFRAGFAYGTGVTDGSNSPTSYLWENANENAPVPFAQVFVRPKLMESDVAPEAPSFVPETGTPAETQPFRLQSSPTPLPWGVTGINDGIAVPSLGAHVTAFAQIGDTLYVGGKFLAVQQGPGGTPVTQSYLAAFNRTTGEWIPGFAPVLDAPVWEIKAAPDGSKLFVGGEFTSVNGQPNTSYLAALNPISGAPVPDWVGFVSRPNASSDVRAMDVQNGWVYVSGNFTRASGGTGTQFTGPITLSRMARFRVSDGRPDGAWKPSIETAAQDLDASAQNDRVYVVGNFKTLNGATLPVSRFAVIGTATPAAAVPNLQPYQQNVNPPTEWLNTVLEVGDKVYVGGSQHVLHQYARSDMTFERSHLTKTGGDYQALAADDGILYASCHCNNWQYEDANTWPDPIGYSQVDQINYFAAHDMSEDLELLRDYQPRGLSATGSGGEGPWEMFPDSESCLWVGGDLVRQGSTGAFYGGFERFCPRDGSVPTAPTNLRSSVDGAANVTLSWNASADDSGASPLYEVLRDDPDFGTVVIGTTYSRSFVDPAVVGAARYFVRAVDPTGNRSASTAALTLQPLPPVVATLLDGAGTWSYRADGADPGAGWNLPGADLSSWASGPAELGWGDGDEATVIPSSGVAQYFVSTVAVASPSDFRTLTVRLRRDDGAAVYVNGIEVARDNLPAGPLTPSTTALTAVSGSGESAWFDFQIPASVLVAGTNTIAVELHQSSAANPDASFNLQLQARSGVETSAPTTPDLSGTATGENRVDLTWTPSSDDQGVIGYTVRRNGQVVAYTSGTAFSDAGVQPNRSYTYEVRAVDRSGNVSAWDAVTLLTPPASVLVRSGDTWSYRSGGSDPGTAWRQPGFDASSWPTGRSELGWGDGDEATTVPVALTQYYVRSFEVDGAELYPSLLLRLKRDDGAAVYVNGIEVARVGLPAGPLTASTFATVSLAGAAESTWVEYVVPGALLRNGTNVIAAEVHQNTNNNADSTFDLELVRRAASETNAPTKPLVGVTGTTDRTASLTWTASTDDVGVFGYVVRRDGQIVTFTTGTSFTDTGLTANTAYGYTVQGVDASGNTSGAGGALAVTTANPVLVGFGDAWRYRFDGVDQGTAWLAPGFDDTGWASGASELGIGDSDEATVIGPATAPTPVTAYFRRTFEVADAPSVTSLTMDVIRDDGFVAYVNGVEVGRNNMPAGAVTYSTRPTTGVALRSDETTPVTLSVPPGVLQTGTNTIAVEMHQANPTSNDLSFNLRLNATFTPVPAVSLTAPGDGAVVSSGPTVVTGLCTTGIEPVTVQLGGDSTDTLTAPCSDNEWSVSVALADGDYTVVASQDDGLGHQPTSTTNSFTVDTQAPAVSIAAPGPGAVFTSGNPSLGGGCTTADGPVQVTIAGSTWQTFEVACVDGGWSLSPTLADDTWAVSVTQSDSSGNVGADGPVGFTVDTAAPVTADNTAGIGGSWRNLPVTVRLTPTDAGVGVAQTYYTVDGSEPTTSSPTGTQILLDADGVYTIRYFSVDAAGNAEPTKTAATQIRIDRTGPQVAVTGPAAGARLNATRWSTACATPGVCGTASDSGVGLLRVDVTITRSNDGRYWNGTGFQTAPAVVTALGLGDWNVPIAINLSNGVTYTVSARGVDLLGNQSAPVVSSFTYDSAAPTMTSVVTSDQDGVVEAGDSFTVAFSEPIDPTTVPATSSLTLSRGSTNNTQYLISGLSNSSATTGATGYLTSGSGTRTVNYGGTLVVAPDARSATFTVTGGCTGSCTSLTTTPQSGTFSYRIASSIRDVAGNGASSSTASLGPQVLF